MRLTRTTTGALLLHVATAAILSASPSSYTAHPVPAGASIHSSPANDTSTAGINAPADNWEASCSVMTGEGHVLTATCYAGDGSQDVTSLDINTCLQNANGILRYPGYVFFHLPGYFLIEVHECLTSRELWCLAPDSWIPVALSTGTGKLSALHA